MITGGCRCGAVRYEAQEGEIAHNALCHCRDCQMAHGAPVVAWIALKTDDFRITSGELTHYEGTSGSLRSFCGKCGTPLCFTAEEMLPGITDVPTVTLDEPEKYAPDAQIQTAERIKWMEGLASLPEFPRYPGME